VLCAIGTELGYVRVGIEQTLHDEQKAHAEALRAAVAEAGEGGSHCEVRAE